jgi:glyoxylase-like metal-dependent hydrolase (beta-lactamase superfamily II)
MHVKTIRLLGVLRRWALLTPMMMAPVLAAPLSTTTATATSPTKTAPVAGTPLQITVYNAPAQSFHVNAVVVTGATEAVVIDTGFSRADALRIAAHVLDSGKTLTAILISNADPDFYFGAEVLKAQFPTAKVLSTAAVRDKIAAKMASKVAFWAPKMAANAPRQPILPDLLPQDQWRVDGEVIQMRGTQGVLAHRPYAYIPSIDAIVGNIAIFHNLHVWTADTQSPAEIAAWQAQLDEIARLQPRLVVPGHMAPGSAQDITAIDYTRTYLQRFTKAANNSANSAELIKQMQAAYPSAGLSIALDIGAKVRMGEMRW